MKALVINVESATARMGFQREQLTRLNIEFSRLPACEIKDKADSVFLQYHNTWERPLSVSEVSCFFSHKSAWDLIIKENTPMLILEDDAFLSDDVPCLLKAFQKLENIDYINLEVRGKNQKKCISNTVKKSFCNASLLRLYQGRSGAAAYVLWPNGARVLIEQLNNKGAGIADKFINANYSLSAYQVEPAPVIQLDQCESYGLVSPLEVKTSISNAKAQVKSGVVNYWRYRSKRLMGEFKVGMNLFKNRHHATRRAIAISNKFKRP